MIAVVDGKEGADGKIVYTSEADIRKDLAIRDTAGASIPPLDETAVSEDAIRFIALLEPALAVSLGSVGENTHFYLFPAETKDRQPIVNSLTKGSLTVVLGQQTFRWRTPLSSLVPRKTCPKCGEKLNGNYLYCPYDATPLPDAEKPAEKQEPAEDAK